MAELREDVYCTLLMSDSYLPGAAVLAHSLRDAGTTKKLAVLVTLETLSSDTVTSLKALYDYLIPVDRIRNRNVANLYMMGRPDLSFTFTKIALWRQTQFRKIVYLDADVVTLRNMDELFNVEAAFAAAPDIGWPDAFNSGVMVISPDMGEYWALQTMAATGESFDGADQGLLNQYFEHRPWQRLKFTYNCTPNAEYQWEPAYRYYKRDISAVHFIGKEKPWSSQRSSSSKPGVYGELLARWWAVFDRHLRQPKAVAPSSFNQSEKSGQNQAKATEGDNSQTHSPAPLSASAIEPQAPSATEPSLTGPGKAADDTERGFIKQPRPVHPRQAYIPEPQWDGTRYEPPTKSKPEAANFPNQTYQFSDSSSLFKAPQAYPEPPRDMWYKVPESRPEPAQRPNPIFPWEREPDRPKATRVFAEDLSPQPTPAPALPSPTHTFSTVHYQNESEGVGRDVTSPQGGSSIVSADQQFQPYQQGSVNAWDNVPGIESYVRARMELFNQGGMIPSAVRESEVGDSTSSLGQRRNRRESLILTDFPSAVERPSLPVTPAPVRRPTFWGEERDETGELPGAEGVPDQTDWNPKNQLEQLRRSSLVEFEHLKKDEHPDPPLRTLPEHSVSTDDSVGASETPQSSHASDELEAGLGSGGGSTDDQLKGQQTAVREVVGGEPQQQLPAPLLNHTKTPEAQGIAGKDFAPGLTETKKEQAPPTSKGFFSDPFPTSFPAKKAKAPKPPTSTQTIELLPSSTYSATDSASSSASTPISSSLYHNDSASGETFKAGRPMFVIPNFEESSSAEGRSNVDDLDVISPTNTRTLHSQNALD